MVTEATRNSEEFKENLYLTLQDASRIYGVIRTIIGICPLEALCHSTTETPDYLQGLIKTDYVAVQHLLESVADRITRALHEEGEPYVGLRREICKQALDISADWAITDPNVSDRLLATQLSIKTEEGLYHLQNLCMDLSAMLVPSLSEHFLARHMQFNVYT